MKLVGACINIEFTEKSSIFIEHNYFLKNLGCFSATVVFSFLIGFGILTENILIENVAFDRWGDQIGSGAAGLFRGTQNSIILLIFERLILNWSEAKGYLKLKIIR